MGINVLGWCLGHYLPMLGDYLNHLTGCYCNGNGAHPYIDSTAIFTRVKEFFNSLCTCVLCFTISPSIWSDIGMSFQAWYQATCKTTRCTPHNGRSARKSFLMDFLILYTQKNESNHEQMVSGGKLLLFNQQFQYLTLLLSTIAGKVDTSIEKRKPGACCELL